MMVTTQPRQHVEEIRKAKEQADVFISCMLDEVSFPSSSFINYTLDLEYFAAALFHIEAALPSYVDAPWLVLQLRALHRRAWLTLSGIDTVALKLGFTLVVLTVDQRALPLGALESWGTARADFTCFAILYCLSFE